MATGFRQITSCNRLHKLLTISSRRLGRSDVRIDNKADLELLIASRKKFAFITKIIGLGKIILIEKKFYVY